MSDSRVDANEVAEALLKMLACKDGCPKKTAYACNRELYEDNYFCPCDCHKAWELLDTLVFQARDPR